ncbi:hypothetical protein [Ligilactobacillus cholophilus]|uniref:hypothetical protein n=1 Tax=Ligilactobacillus cholophilus TaxID=3050131 RepID=UPI0025AF50D2|nr:hypothetical protein [Ligilactobacillus cholophilus]
MKKSRTSLSLIAILALMLAGCGNSNNQNQNKKEASHAKTEQVKKQHKSKTSSSESSQVKTASSSVTSVADNKNGDAQQTKQDSSIVANADSENSNSNNVATDGTSTQDFSTNEQAVSYITNQGYRTSQSTQGLPTVNLGYGITGTIDSGAGQQYLHWNEGNWSFTVRSSNVEGQNPIPTAQKIVNTLQSTYLPAPQNRGTGTFDIATGNYQLTWQKNNKVYTVTGNSPENVIQKAVNMN